MQLTPEGIDITEKDGTPLSCGNYFYWDAELSQILMHKAGKFCPDVKFEKKDEKSLKKDGKSFKTRFHRDTDKGVELCGRSKSLADKRVRIPQKDLDEFIAAIDELHKKSESVGLPAENKAFMHDFAVPNPLSMKSAWRVTTGFSKRLLVLWGYTTASASDAVILPLTPTSAKWDDAPRRKDLKQLLSGQLSKHKFNWGKLFRFLLYSLLGILLLLLLLMVIGNISEHKCCICQGETTFSLKQFPYVCDKCGKAEKECRCKTSGSTFIEKQPDTVVEKQLDGTVKETKSDGTVTEKKPDGTVTEKKPDGTVKETKSDGTVTEKKPDGTVTEKKPDGTVKETKSDGTVTEKKPDGTVTEKKPDGTIVETKPDGTIVETKPDGTVTKKKPGDVCPKCGSELDKDGKCPNICNKCHQEHIKDGKCPKCDVPAIADFTFTIKLDRKNDKGELAEVVFSVAPDNCMKNTNYTVHSWSINGDLKAQGDQKQFSAELSYKMRYVISAIVTVDGKEQKVLPYQWNSVDAPVWMISRVGNADNEYQVLCTNSSNMKVDGVKWSKPVFRNGKKENISEKFDCPEPVAKGNNRVRVTWSQNYMGEYIVTLKADVKFSDGGKRSGGTQVSNTFIFINGSRTQALISQKFDNAKDRIYHCLATNMDGTQHNGTAFAVTDKLLLTNYHVAVGNIPEYYGGEEGKVDPSKLLVLSNEKRMLYAKVIKSDRATDMALLKLCDRNGGDTDTVLPEYFIVAKSEPEINARVFSVGYPAGTTKFGEPAFADGKIENAKNVEGRGELIRHFSNIQPGYSGGPLVYMDKDSVVIGVNSSGLVTGTPEAQGVNIATSALEIRKKFPEIFNAGR